MTDDQLQALHDHLAATAERPVERTASRWLGEAEAVAADLVAGDLADDVLTERLAKIAHILANVNGTDDAVADDHVAAARDIVDRCLPDE
ncbi:MAG: hypothetical protein ABEH86_11970 [Haloarcula sp.]